MNYRKYFKVYYNDECVSCVSAETYQDLRMYFKKDVAKREILQIILHEVQKHSNDYNCNVKAKSIIYMDGFDKVIRALLLFIEGRL